MFFHELQFITNLLSDLSERETLFLGSVSQELHIHFSRRRENVNRRHLNE